MNYLYYIMDRVEALPDAVNLYVCPGLLLIVGLLLAIFGAKKAYLPVALALGAAEFFLVFCKDPNTGFAVLALFVVFAVLVSLLFLIPFRSSRGETETPDELYEKFHVPLELPEEEGESEEPKAELFERDECGLRLTHASQLLEQLQTSNLSATDRLEADALSHTLDSYRDRELSAEEMRALNDCLATILKLTAKYKL